MSETIGAAGRVVAACQDVATGEAFYLLAMLMQQSDGTERLSVRFFGRAGAVMQHVVQCAPDRDGGEMPGDVDQDGLENYIRGWREQLARPVAMRMEEVAIAFGPGLHEIDEARRPAVEQVLQRHGRKLDAGRFVTFDPASRGELALLADLVAERERTGVHAWRLWTTHAFDFSTSREELGLAVPVVQSCDLSGFEVHRLPGDSDESMVCEPCYLLRCGEHVLASGRAVHVMDAFIRMVAAPMERDRLGMAEAAIGNFRQRLLEAKELPGGAQIELWRAPRPDLGRRYAKVFEDVISALGWSGCAAMSVSIEALRNVHALKQLRRVHPEQLRITAT